MKILLLADRSSIHTVRWANSLAERGYEIHLASCHSGDDPLSDNVYLHPLKGKAPFCYYLAVFGLKKLIAEIQPDLVHAHYASGYGTLARLAGFHPYVLSVWGSDVYDFPYRNRWNYRVLLKNLQSADRICSTSYAMAKHTKELSADIGHISVIPFGIDIGIFEQRDRRIVRENITVGTVKGLSDKYGIDILIESFANARKQIREYNHDLSDRMRLLIVGGGDKRNQLEGLASKLEVDDITTFVGPVLHEQVPSQLHKLDIYVALSRSESFGVAVLEASASGLPVIVSDVGGLPEVVEDNTTGMIVVSEDVEHAAHAIKKLVLDAQLRERFGKSGHDFVMKNYEWQVNVTQMESIYKEVLSGKTYKSANN